MSVAFGILGLGGFVAILLLGLGSSYRMAITRRDAAGIFALGVLMAMLLEWFNGDLYASSWLVWLCLGFVDGWESRRVEAAEDLALAAIPARPPRRRWTSA